MKPAAYYNEIDPFAAQWLRNLIAGGHIAPGEVDERSIEDVTPDDLKEFTQCHFFAGIGVWSHSLRLAGWPDDKPAWTGSCPCQPFSASGKGDGFDDERHLWPAFQWLISECRPQCVFGEQVAASGANAWFDLVQSDMEGMDYAFGLVPFTSASIGAPHIRERAYWVAHATGEHQSSTRDEARVATRCGSGTVNGMGNANITRLEGFGRNGSPTGWQGKSGSVAEAGILNRPLEVNGFWRDADWLLCRDGRWRPVESGTFPLVNGTSSRLVRKQPSVAPLARMASRNRTGRLKGYGNAVNAYAAAEFIKAAMQAAL